MAAQITKKTCLVFLFLFYPLLIFAQASPPLADEIVVIKSKRKLYLYSQKKLLKEYPIVLGSNPVGAKSQEGDGKTPEGKYWIDARNPQSAYHLSLHISYPNSQDSAQAKAAGVSPGGQIMIHGMPPMLSWLSSGMIQKLGDWTRGCIAMSNAEIEEIWKLVPDGTPIEIRP